MQHPEPVARRLFDLTEPISLVNFCSPRAQRRDGDARLQQLLGRLLRRPLRAARPGPG